jgi:membrane fusion protein
VRDSKPHARAERLLAFYGPETLLLATVAAFVIVAAVVLRVFSVHDYIDNIDGAITTDVPPVKIISEDQYRISRVFKHLGERVRRGDPLIQLDGAQQRITLLKLEKTLEAKRSELQYSRDRLAGTEQKIELNARITERKLRLASLDAGQTKMTIELDARRQKAAREIQALSEKILARTIPALDTPALSDIEKARVLSTAHADLRQMHQVASEVRANQNRVERERLLTQIEVTQLQDQWADLQLARADIQRTIDELTTEVATLEQERMEIRNALSRLLIRSPADGSVIRISPNILNANLVERNEELFLIHGDGSKLEAELLLTDEQFKDARVGQRVNLELHAWNHYKHGVIRGRIVSISGSKVMPKVLPAKTASFAAVVRIDPGQRLSLRPGYDLKARIILGEVSLLDYMLKKIRFQ